MSGTDTRLRELMDVAVGEPPGSISVPEVRRLARRRRTLHGITATSTAAACCAVLSVLALGLAAPLSGHSPTRASSLRPGVPRYYIQEQQTVWWHEFYRALVRDTATGAVTASFRCPWSGAAIAGIAAAGNNVFFMACQRTSKSLVADTQLYRFQLTSAGRIPGYSPVPGGALPGLVTDGLTAAADGSEIAMSTATTGRPARPYAGLLVINTRTGAHAFWRANGPLSLGQDLTLSPNGRDLRFFTTGSTVVPVVNGSGHPEERQVSPASKGGQLSSARVLVRVPSQKSVVYAWSNPGGSVVTEVAVQGRASAAKLVVKQISGASGRVIRVLFRAGGRGINAYFTTARSDPTGRYIILEYATNHGVFNGWLDHGHLVPLTPLQGAARRHIFPVYETW